MSVHLLPIDVQELARAVQDIRECCNLIEHILEQALIEANNNERNNITVDSNS